MDLEWTWTGSGSGPELDNKIKRICYVNLPQSFVGLNLINQSISSDLQGFAN